ncbi:MAG: hypothetical protein JF565_09305 [Propionibacteriales bacterium]|nr:hypothetical protein [Propionibacteriales bacterium]
MVIPPWLANLVDDAAIFPPGNLPLDRAVAAHREHKTSEYAAMVGNFVVSDVKIADLIDLLDDDPSLVEPVETSLAITLVVTGGAGAIEPAVRWASRAPTVQLSGLECALRDEDDLAHNAGRVCSMLDSLEEELAGVDVFVEPPRVVDRPSHGWLLAADELAMRELPLKFRTGGVAAEAFPTPAELAACITAALDRELPFKCTAGLHHALRQIDPETGFTHHGFLNVLAATRACLDGGSTEGALALTEPAELLDGLDGDALARTRRWFTSFGSCSILEPHDDLVELGLIEPEATA